ncbi:MAG: GNAT family N-acetyltransferase [Candidatus Contendobacter sp.]|nr:GNAT family N-acetyltransferase [Candidatus Contendobacter sp.]MDG4556332.1 GNAT family N-acetyltransferase [Candidatus Contendobacter sp.]
MPTFSSRSLFNPASIALIGASERPGSIGAALTRNLLAGGFKGELFLVNRHHARVQNMPARQHLADLPRAPELAVIATPPPTVPELLTTLGRHGARITLIATAAGSRDEARIWRDVARSQGLRLLGPGSCGVIAPRWGLNASLSPVFPRPGHLALIAPEGSVLTPILEWATAQDIGFSSIVALGDGDDLNYDEVLDGLSHDPDTRAILLVLETLSSSLPTEVATARPFLSAARAAAQIKPVLAVRLGRGGDAFSRQTDAIYDAAFRRVGILRVQSLRELLWTAETLELDSPVTGDRLAIFGNGRGLGLLAADALLAEGGRLARWSSATQAALADLLPPGVAPTNPLDLGMDADPARFAAAVTLLLRDTEIDGLLALHAPSALNSATDAANAVIEALVHSPPGARAGVLACWLGADSVREARRRFQTQGIPSYDTPNDAIHAFMHRWRHRRHQLALMETPPDLPELFGADLATGRQLIQTALAEGRDQLTTAETRTLLAAHGIVLASNEGTSASPVPPGSPAWSIRLVHDPAFGPVLRFGPSETAASSDEYVIALPPLNPVLAREALRHGRIGQRPQDIGVTEHALNDFALMLVKVAQLIADLGEVVELELEPIFTVADRVVVGGARIGVATFAGPAHRRLAIRPYPRELEETVPLPDGGALLIRPVRPEDEPAFVAGFARLSPEEVRMRFMHTVKELTHADMARLTQIDYDREMALGVLRQRPGQAPEGCGVARLVGDPDREGAEFAIILTQDAVGMGLSSLLLRRLISYARDQGIHELFGEILAENQPMLALCRAMGFTIKSCPEDHGVMIATLRLT